MEKIINWIKNNKKEFLILALILLVGSFCRLYKIDQYMTFLGDEGRDVIVVRRLLVEGHPPLIGPGTSIGNMYLGPLYYYMMAPALLIANFSPVGPAIEIALLGIVTIAFVWWVGREWFGKIAGLTAAALYAIAPTVIIYSRSSWNPNIMPFFSLLCIYSIWKVWKGRSFWWLIITGGSFAAALQSHYLGLLLAPTFGIFWLLTLIKIKDTAKIKSFVKFSLIGALVFFLLMSPLVIFDFRHNFINFNAMKKFFTMRQETVSIRPWTAIPKLPEIFVQISESLISAKNVLVGKIISAVLVVCVALLFVFKKPNIRNTTYYLLFSWIGFGLIGFGLYKQQIYDHYFGFMFTAIFLLIGAFFQFFSSYRKAVPFLILVFLGLTAINLFNSPLKYLPNNQLKRAELVAEKIGQESSGGQFNLAVIAERNYQDGYKYFLLKNNKKVVEIDAQRPETITSQLFAVCEEVPSKCDPTNNPRAEIANFGWSKIDNQWEVMGVTIYKLIHRK